MKIFKTTILTLALLATISTYAQEAEATSEETTEEPTFSVSGSIDTYYRSNREAPPTSFADLPGFALGMANIILSYEGEKHGFVADFVYGPRGEDAVFGSQGNGSSSIINQMYAYYNLSDKFTLTLGNFNTFLGYEVISPAANFNYSTSYLFSYGPFSHTGLKADFTLSENTSLMLAIMNPTDATEFNPTGNYAFGAQLGLSGQYFNFLYDSGAYEVDFTGGFDVSETFFLGVNAAYFSGGDEAPGFYGAALYPQIATSDSFKIGLRTEYFVEDGDFGAIGTGVEDSSVFATTLTGNYSIGSLTIIPELRLDSASEAAFVGDKALSSFALAAVYSF